MLENFTNESSSLMNGISITSNFLNFEGRAHEEDASDCYTHYDTFDTSGIDTETQLLLVNLLFLE